MADMPYGIEKNTVKLRSGYMKSAITFVPMPTQSRAPNQKLLWILVNHFRRFARNGSRRLLSGFAILTCLLV